MSIKFILVVLEMLYRMKKKFLKNSHTIVQRDPKQKKQKYQLVFFFEIFAAVSKFILFLIFYIEEVNMSIKYILVVLEMLYRIKKKKLKNPHTIVKCDPKQKSGARLMTGTVFISFFSILNKKDLCVLLSFL